MSKYVNVTKMSITLDNSVANELNALAKELNEKKSHVIENALMLYFDMLDEKISDKRLREVEEGTVKTISAEEVWKELGI
jgi:RHH-type transcriptional regulator, rel operon repressor / antitoxin RelB